MAIYQKGMVIVMHPDFDPQDRERPVEGTPVPSDTSDDAQEESYGGFKYKLEYDAYQEAAHKKAAVKGKASVKEKTPVDIFLISLAVFFVLCIFTVSAMIVLKIHKGSESDLPPVFETEETESVLTTLITEVIFETKEEPPLDTATIDAVYIERLGISGQIVTNELSETYRIPCGFLVKNIYDGSGSDIKKSGLELWDIIVSIDSLPVSASDDIEKILSAHVSGDALLLGIYRNEAYIDLAVTYTVPEN